ncbi:MAG: hypothetical protein KIT36_13110 [Alphaproteobacteria bacterium]|nr:hypothetical protein [Alphaproteobacteria bacterium]
MLLLIGGAMLALTGGWGQGGAPSGDPDSARQAPRSEARAPAGHKVWGPSVGFASRDRLEDHYRKHGAEFGDISRQDYLRQAQTLRDAPAGGAILTATRGDGVTTRFDRRSGAFLAFNADGVIRTFFRPNDGERYFHRQLERDR